MSSQNLDEQAIFEVAREIQNPDIRAKYLSQVCHDQRLLGRLEGRLMTAGRRWQFSLRTLLVATLLLGCLSGGAALIAWQAIRAEHAERLAVQERARAVEAAQRAAAVIRQLETDRAHQQVAVGSSEERTP